MVFKIMTPQEIAERMNIECRRGPLTPKRQTGEGELAEDTEEKPMSQEANRKRLCLGNRMKKYVKGGGPGIERPGQGLAGRVLLHTNTETTYNCDRTSVEEVDHGEPGTKLFEECA